MSVTATAALQTLLHQLQTLATAGRLPPEEAAKLTSLAIQAANSGELRKTSESQFNNGDTGGEDDDVASNAAVTSERRGPRSSLGLPPLSEISSDNVSDLDGDNASGEADDEDFEATSTTATGERRGKLGKRPTDGMLADVTAGKDVITVSTAPVYTSGRDFNAGRELNGQKFSPRDRSLSVTGIADTEKKERRQYGLQEPTGRASTSPDHEHDVEIDVRSDISVSMSLAQRSLDAGWSTGVKRVVFREHDEVRDGDLESQSAPNGRNHQQDLDNSDNQEDMDAADLDNPDNQEDMDAAEGLHELAPDDVGDADVGEDALAPRFSVTTSSDNSARRNRVFLPARKDADRERYSRASTTADAASADNAGDVRSIMCASPRSESAAEARPVNLRANPEDSASQTRSDLGRIPEAASRLSSAEDSVFDSRSQNNSMAGTRPHSAVGGASTSTKSTKTAFASESHAGASGGHNHEALTHTSARRSERSPTQDEDIGAPAREPVVNEFLATRRTQAAGTMQRPLELMSVASTRTGSAGREPGVETASVAVIYGGPFRDDAHSGHSRDRHRRYQANDQLSDFSSDAGENSFAERDPDVLVSEQLIVDHALDGDAGDADLHEIGEGSESESGEVVGSRSSDGSNRLNSSMPVFEGNMHSRPPAQSLIPRISMQGSSQSIKSIAVSVGTRSSMEEMPRFGVASPLLKALLAGKYSRGPGTEKIMPAQIGPEDGESLHSAQSRDDTYGPDASLCDSDYGRGTNGSFNKAAQSAGDEEFDDEEQYGLAHSSEDDFASQVSFSDYNSDYPGERGTPSPPAVAASMLSSGDAAAREMKRAALRRLTGAASPHMGAAVTLDQGVVFAEGTSEHSATWAESRCAVTRWDQGFTFSDRVHSDDSLSLRALCRATNAVVSMSHSDWKLEEFDESVSRRGSNPSYSDLIVENTDSDVEFDMDELLAIYDAQKRHQHTNRPQTAKPGRPRIRLTEPKEFPSKAAGIAHVTRPGTAHPRRRPADLTSNRKVITGAPATAQQFAEETADTLVVKRSNMRAQSARLPEDKEFHSNAKRRLWSASAARVSDAGLHASRAARHHTGSTMT